MPCAAILAVTAAMIIDGDTVRLVSTLIEVQISEFTC